MIELKVEEYIKCVKCQDSEYLRMGIEQGIKAIPLFGDICEYAVLVRLYHARRHLMLA